jgi:plasmid stabilization system protein ParE
VGLKVIYHVVFSVVNLTDEADLIAPSKIDHPTQTAIAPYKVTIIESSYRIIYYIKTEEIDILAVLHGSQQINSTEEK